VRVAQIVTVIERDRARRDNAGRRGVVEPIIGLNIVLGAGGRRAARSASAERRLAQSLKKIVRSAVLLHHNNDVLKARDLTLHTEGAAKTQ
jgi:hypothetical protein